MAVITGFLAAAIGGGAMAQVMVLRADGPSQTIFSPGTMLPANRPVPLQAGDHITLLDGAGALEIVGPGEQLPNRPSAAINPQLMAMLGQFRSGSSAGAARGEARGPTVAPSNIWQVSLSSTGNFCFAIDQPIALWREKTLQTAKVMITRPSDDDDPGVSRKWPSGNHALDWPTADLPLADGEVYQIAWSDNPAGRNIVWRKVDPPSTGWPEFASQLLKNGCDSQLETIAAAMPQPGS
jgi:hypothetical protein